jgi:hypothetical protein
MKEALERAEHSRKSPMLWVGLGLLVLLAAGVATYLLLG